MLIPRDYYIKDTWRITLNLTAAPGNGKTQGVECKCEVQSTRVLHHRDNTPVSMRQGVTNNLFLAITGRLLRWQVLLLVCQSQTQWRTRCGDIRDGGQMKQTKSKLCVRNNLSIETNDIQPVLSDHLSFFISYLALKTARQIALSLLLSFLVFHCLPLSSIIFPGLPWSSLVFPCLLWPSHIPTYTVEVTW